MPADRPASSQSRQRAARVGLQSASGWSAAPARGLPPAGSESACAGEGPQQATRLAADAAVTLGTSDQELAAYLLARALLDRPVSPPTRALLQSANDIHAGRLLDGERLVTQRASNRDHSWLMLEGIPRADGTPRRAIIDVWAEGPVTEPADNQFTGDPASPPVDLQCIESADAQALSRQFSEARSNPGERTVRRLQLLIDANARAGKQPTGRVYPPVASVSSQFQGLAKAAVEGHQGDPSLRAEVAALARELVPGLAQADEQSTKDAILAVAADLAAPRQRQLESAAAKRKRSADDSD